MDAETTLAVVGLGGTLVGGVGAAIAGSAIRKNRIRRILAKAKLIREPTVGYSKKANKRNGK